MSILYGKDERGNIVRVNDAKTGPYFCPTCGAKMHKKRSSQGKLYFCCYPNVEHSNSICQNLLYTRVTHTVKHFEPDKFFKKIFTSAGSSPKAPADTSVHPTSDSGPDLIVDYVNPELEQPFTSLRQVYTEGLKHFLNPHDQITPEKEAIDIFAFTKWAPMCFENNRFTGGPLLVEAMPERPLPNRCIAFTCFWKAGVHEETGKTIWHRVHFHMAFGSEDEFRHYLNILLKKEPDETGKMGWCSNYPSVLLAGNWQKLNYSDSSHPYFQCDFVNKNQIFYDEKAKVTT